MWPRVVATSQVEEAREVATMEVTEAGVASITGAAPVGVVPPLVQEHAQNLLSLTRISFAVIGVRQPVGWCLHRRHATAWGQQQTYRPWCVEPGGGSMMLDISLAVLVEFRCIAFALTTAHLTHPQARIRVRLSTHKSPSLLISLSAGGTGFGCPSGLDNYE